MEKITIKKLSTRDVFVFIFLSMMLNVSIEMMKIGQIAKKYLLNGSDLVTISHYSIIFAIISILLYLILRNKSCVLMAVCWLISTMMFFGFLRDFSGIPAFSTVDKPFNVMISLFNFMFLAIITPRSSLDSKKDFKTDLNDFSSLWSFNNLFNPFETYSYDINNKTLTIKYQILRVSITKYDVSRMSTQIRQEQDLFQRLIHRCTIILKVPKYLSLDEEIVELKNIKKEDADKLMLQISLNNRMYNT